MTAPHSLYAVCTKVKTYRNEISSALCAICDLSVADKLFLSLIFSPWRRSMRRISHTFLTYMSQPVDVEIPFVSFLFLFRIPMLPCTGNIQCVLTTNATCLTCQSNGCHCAEKHQ